jgi:hypothetical protein
VPKYALSFLSINRDKSMLKLHFSVVFILMCMILMSSTPVSHQNEGGAPPVEVPAEVARKFKRDAARLALRLQTQDKDVKNQPIVFVSQKTEDIYQALCQVYLQTDQGKSFVKCNIHTFPNPSIDHMVLIYQKNVAWASPLSKGLLQTNSQRFNDLVARYKLILEKHIQWTDHQFAIALRSKEPINMAALAEEFRQIEGIDEIDLGIPKVLGNDIQVLQADGNIELEYILRFGAWSAGKGQSHTWRFAANSKTIKATADFGAPVPAWLKCHFQPEKQSDAKF